MFLEMASTGFIDEIPRMGGLDSFIWACGNSGEKSTEVLVVCPDWGRNGFELRDDMAVSDVTDQRRRLLIRSGIILPASVLLLGREIML